MSARRQGSVVPAMVLILALATGCGGGGVEGSYYNTVTGDFAFELKGGRVYTANGEEDPNLKYEVRGDEVVLLPKDGAEEGELRLQREPDGVLSMGMLGKIKKR